MKQRLFIDMWAGHVNKCQNRRGSNKFADFINYDKLEAYKGFGGIRNEEDFVITEDGYKLIGKPKPKTIEDVEKQKHIAFT